MKLARDARGGVLVMPEVFTTVHRDTIVAAAARHRVPTIYPDEISTTRGELMSYGIDPADVFLRSASYRPHSQRGKPRQPGGAESDQIHADNQSQDSAGHGTSSPADAACARRRRDGMIRPRAP